MTRRRFWNSPSRWGSRGRDTDTMHITVDYTLCEGHGQCLMAAPELFDLPDGADQVVVLDADPPESERDRAVRAAAMCPALAITVS